MSRILFILSLLVFCVGCGAEPDKPAPAPGGTGTGTSMAPAPAPVATPAPAMTVEIPAAIVDSPAAPAPAAEAEEPSPGRTPEAPSAVAGEPATEGVAAAAAAGDTGGEPEVVAEPDEELFPEPKSATVNARTLNVRVGPSIEKRLITTLKRDRQVNVVGRKGNWLKVELPSDITLWIVGKYVTVVEGQALPTTGTVNAPKVRVRSGGDYKAPILRLLDMDTQVEVTERSGEWLRIKAPAGTFAWVHGNYLKFGAGETPPAVAVGPGTETPGPGTETPGPGTETPGPGTETPGPGTETPGPGTEPTVKPTVVEGTGAQALTDADTAYRTELAGNNPNLLKVFLMYHDIATTPNISDLIRRTCDARMREIASKMPVAERKRIDEEVKKRVEERLAEIERARREAIAQLPKVAPKFTAVGFLERSPEVAGIPGTHKLTMSGVLLYYLNASAEGVDLEKFTDRKVGVIGRKRYVQGWGIQVIDVTELRDFQDVPKTRATFGGPAE